MNRPAIQPYVDARLYASSPVGSRGVFEGAQDLLSRYIGSMNVLPLRQLHVLPWVNIVKPARLIERKKRYPFVSLLTRRTIAVPDSSAPAETLLTGLDGICYFRNPEKRRLGSLVITSVGALDSESDIDRAVTTTTHEWAHGLGLDHCDEKLCLMQPKLPADLKVYLSVAPSQFCLEHTTELLNLTF